MSKAIIKGNGGESTIDEIELMFYKEVAEKSKTGRGIHNRASRKKGFKGGIRFPHDNMSRAERKKMNGVCIVSNIYDVIMTYEEWKMLNDEDRVLYINKWIERHGMKAITDKWEKPSRLYDNMRKYGIVNQGRQIGGRRKAKEVEREVAVEKVEEQKEVGRNWEQENAELRAMLQEAQKRAEIMDIELRARRAEPSFSMGLSGIFDGDALSGRILKMVDVLEKEKQYEIKLNISEK